MANKSRTQKAILNVISGFLNELVSLVCGLVLSHMILYNFGSAYNGITQSISQFISYISIMRAGIGSTTVAVLHKPLADNDNLEVSRIIGSMDKFMKKIAMIFIVFVIGISIIYPTFIVKDYDWLFTASLVFIISISTFAQYYIGFTYQTVLNADQKEYITTYVGTIGIILDTVVCKILIESGASIHVIKLFGSMVSVFSSIFIYLYVKKKYHIVKVEDDGIDRIPQKWDAAIQEVASFVNSNSDITILTFFANPLEISVYTTYRSITSNLKKIVNNATKSFTSAFGDMYFKGEKELVVENLGIFELITFSLTSILYSVTLVMIVPFVMIYTKGIVDVNYNRPLFALVLVMSSAFNCIQIPYKRIVEGIGHFKQTKKGAIIEAIINLSVSVIGTLSFGLVGVVLGTLCAMMFRTLHYLSYLSKNVLDRKISLALTRIGACLFVILVVYFVSFTYIPTINTWFEWILYAIITTSVSVIISLIIALTLYKNDSKIFLTKITRTIFKKRNA